MAQGSRYKGNASIPRRDAGLDFIRALAIPMMVLAHYPFPAELNDRVSHLIWSIGDAAPALFFFAFGMTFDRFLAKSAPQQRDLNLLFLYVGLAHDLLLRHGILVINFLAFLCLWRVVLAVAERRGRWRNGYYLAVLAAYLLADSFLPQMLTQHLFLDKNWAFPFIPWGTFILAGLVFARTGSARQRWVFILSLLLMVLGYWYLGSKLAAPALAFHKKPLSAPYIVLGTAASALMVEGVRVLGSWYHRVPVVPRLTEYISRNLLLATVLHYLGLHIAAGISRFEGGALLDRLPGLSQTGPARYLALSGAAFAATVLALPVIRGTWHRVAGSALLERLRANRDATAIVILLILTVLVRFKILLSGPGLARLTGLALDPAMARLASLLIGALVLAALTYFCQEMSEYRARR